jgi:hypothetical protein
VYAQNLSWKDAYGRAKQQPYADVMRNATEEIQKQGKRKLLLLLDELVFFLKKPNRNDNETRNLTREFLTALCACTSQHIVAGSEDFYEFVQNYQIGLEGLPVPFRNAERYALHHLPEERTEIELRRVLIGTGMVPDQNDIKWMRENLDLVVPYPTLCFLDEIDSQVRPGKQLDVAALDRELRRFFRETHAFKDLEWHITKFQDQYPQLAQVARSAVTKLANLPWSNGIARDELETSFMTTENPLPGFAFRWFKETFPIADEKNLPVRIVSRVFRQWWKQREEL